jgi:hypothetical protein
LASLAGQKLGLIPRSEFEITAIGLHAIAHSPGSPPEFSARILGASDESSMNFRQQ